MSLNGLTTEHLAILIEAFLGLLIGIILAMSYTWKMGLITIALVPFVSLGGVMMSRMQFKARPDKDSSDKDGKEDPYKKSNALLSDILMNYRTVIGFGSKNVDFLLQKFDALLDAPSRHGIKNAHISGIYFGYSQCIRFIFVGIIFLVSAEIVYYYTDDQSNIYIGVYTLFVSALGTGISLSSAPSVAKAKASAANIFEIIDEPSQIDTRSEEGVKVIKHGEIQFRGTEFQYPSRSQKVLNRLNMRIPATKKIALVGHSGCGKSTIANLLLRLYDTTGGKLLIDGIDIKDYNVRELRK